MSSISTSPSSALSVRSRRRSLTRAREAPIYAFLFICAALSIVTTLGIVLVLFEETLKFFDEVNVVEFLTGTRWTPLFTSKHFGVLPLLNATILMAFIAVCIALPLGVLAAIYLSE